MAFKLLILTALTVATAADEASAKASGSPMGKIVNLLKGMEQNVEKEGRAEQASYDKYSCWVEDTLRRKASDISKAKSLIDELKDTITKLNAQLGSHGAEIANLKKEIVENKEATREATGVRSKDRSDYQEKKSESEQCIASLGAAIKVLTGAGTKKAGFMQQDREVELMDVASGVGRVLRMTSEWAATKFSDEQLAAVRSFVKSPRMPSSALLQDQNPFGDFAPQSSQVQGVLKGMYDSFVADLAKEKSDEAASQKNFESLVAAKAQELKTLKSTFQRHQTDEATKTKKLSEANTLRDDTSDQADADEKYFEETKGAAEAKAIAWSTRMRLRTEELVGMQSAIEILSGGSKVFQTASKFIQLKAVTQHKHTAAAFRQIEALAAKHQSVSLMRVVAMMKSGGHFDSVISKIDSMIALCRQEQQDDIKHRDRCENKLNANKNDLGDAKALIDKSKRELKRMANADSEMRQALGTIQKQIKDTKADLKELSDLRNKDHKDFQHALKMDRQSVELIAQATASLTKFYKENKIAVRLLQAPTYSKDSSKAPKTDFNGADAHKSESRGIVSMLDMMKEDFQKEMKEGLADEAQAQAEYKKQKGALQDTLDAQSETKVSLERERASLNEKANGAKKFKKETQDDLSAAKSMKKSLDIGCKWVGTHFETRRKKRKTEMDGLVEAKDFLAGVQEGKAVLAPQ